MEEDFPSRWPQEGKVIAAVIFTKANAKAEAKANAKAAIVTKAAIVIHTANAIESEGLCEEPEGGICC